MILQHLITRKIYQARNNKETKSNWFGCVLGEGQVYTVMVKDAKMEIQNNPVFDTLLGLPLSGTGHGDEPE